MKFWDTSAIAAICVGEPGSAKVKTLLIEDPVAVVWWATRTECISALARRVRDGRLTPSGERRAREILRRLADVWTEIQPSEAVRTAAERFLAVHPLRAADAFQLAAASLWCQGQASGHALVSFDARLREAAAREGFAALPD